MNLKISPNIADIIPYPPGKPLEELEREYGISGSIKLASNENPWGPSPLAVESIQKALMGLNRYPDGSSYYLTHALAKWLEVNPSEIVLGNGSNEVIEFLVKALISSGDEVITSHPSFLMYQNFVQIRGGNNIIVPVQDMTHNLIEILKSITSKTRLIFLDNPNNPCGSHISIERFNEFIDKVPEEVTVVLDEAYVDFVPPEERIDVYSYIQNSQGKPAVVSLRTFSKAFGLAGLRVGFGIMHQKIAEIVHRVRQPFNINLLGQVGALAALEDKKHYNWTLSETIKGRNWLSQEVETMGCRAYPSYTNFFLIDVGGDATRLYELMLRKGVIVRSMKAYGYPDFIRITVGTESENKRFINTLRDCMLDMNYA